MELTVEKLAKIIDHTLLKAEANRIEIKRLCDDARRYGFGAVCVNPSRVKQAATLLQEAEVAVCTVVGFPLGAGMPLTKSYEAELAIRDGADEVDMVMNIGALKDRKVELVADDITEVVKTVRAESRSAIVKVIIETCLLTQEEIVQAAEIIRDTGADFVKTSTGFSTGGAKVEDIKLIKSIVGDELGIKASGGIRTLEDAKAMIEAGANRIGTSSGISILEEMGGKN